MVKKHQILYGILYKNGQYFTCPESDKVNPETDAYQGTKDFKQCAYRKTHALRMLKKRKQ